MNRKLRSDVAVSREAEVIAVFDPVTLVTFELMGDLTDETLWDAVARAGLEEGFGPGEIRARQQAFRLEALVSFATSHVPYYRERAALYGGPLATLPLMRKADLRAHFPQGLVADGVDVAGLVDSGAVWYGRTSGSTDERVQTLLEGHFSPFPPSFQRAWGLPPDQEHQRIGILTTPVCMGNQCHLGALPMSERRQGDYLFFNSTDDLFSLGRERVENIVAEWNVLEPEIVLAHPMYLHWLAIRAEAYGLKLPSPRFIISGFQLRSRIQRRALAERFGVPVYDYYGATDLGGGGGAVECAEGRLHVREDQCLFEILDDDGRPVEDGIGHLAITTLENRVVPLIRYLVGDVGRWVHTPCSCPLAGWRSFEIHGRAKDTLTVGGRRVTSRQVDDVVGEVPGLAFYRVTQTGAHAAVMEAMAEPSGAFDAREAREALAALGFRETAVRRVDRLDPERSLKFRTTVPCFATPEVRSC